MANENKAIGLLVNDQVDHTSLTWEFYCPCCNTCWTDGTEPIYFFCKKCYPILQKIVKERMSQDEKTIEKTMESHQGTD